MGPSRRRANHNLVLQSPRLRRRDSHEFVCFQEDDAINCKTRRALIWLSWTPRPICVSCARRTSGRSCPLCATTTSMPRSRHQPGRPAARPIRVRRGTDSGQSRARPDALGQSLRKHVRRPARTAIMSFGLSGMGRPHGIAGLRKFSNPRGMAKGAAEVAAALGG